MKNKALYYYKLLFLHNLLLIKPWQQTVTAKMSKWLSARHFYKGKILHNNNKIYA